MVLWLGWMMYSVPLTSRLTPSCCMSCLIGCKLDRETAERYKSYCAEQGTTPNSEIKAFILSQLGEQPAD